MAISASIEALALRSYKETRPDYEAVFFCQVVLRISKRERSLTSEVTLIEGSKSLIKTKTENFDNDSLR